MFSKIEFFCCLPIACDSTDPGVGEYSKEIYSAMFPKGAGPMCQTSISKLKGNLCFCPLNLILINTS